MVFRRDQLKRTVHPPAKLNLYLEVLGRRSDGYHELETLMVPIGIRDSLTIVPIPAPQPAELGEINLVVRPSFTSDACAQQGADVPVGSENLVVRALKLLREHSGSQAGAMVWLTKRIPSAAGLGGGSSDAAAALHLGNRLWRLGYSTSHLATLGAKLGSDVPFFVRQRAAICRGRGEKVQPISAVARFHAVILKPPVGLSTPEVFQAYDRLAADISPQNRGAERIAAMVSALRRGHWSELARRMINRLEAPAAALSPWLHQVRAVFDRLNCLGHQLSGSGSAYFGLCRHAAHSHNLATILRAQRLGQVFVAASCP